MKLADKLALDKDMSWLNGDSRIEYSGCRRAWCAAQELATAHDALMQQMAEALTQARYALLAKSCEAGMTPHVMQRSGFTAALASIDAGLRAYKEQCTNIHRS